MIDNSPLLMALKTEIYSVEVSYPEERMEPMDGNPVRYIVGERVGHGQYRDVVVFERAEDLLGSEWYVILAQIVYVRELDSFRNTFTAASTVMPVDDNTSVRFDEVVKTVQSELYEEYGKKCMNCGRLERASGDMICHTCIQQNLFSKDVYGDDGDDGGLVTA